MIKKDIGQIPKYVMPALLKLLQVFNPCIGS